jgi:glycosyltransferase involved in cell wall biosynthesis
MTISVVITAYNLERYIAEAIQSVICQTRKADEIIVVDDCSTDNTANEISKFQLHVRYIRHPKNLGALKNTLEGLKRATGDIITFLDGDDVWLPEKLNKIEESFLNDESTILVSHDFIRCNEQLEPLGILDQTNLNTARIIKCTDQEEWNIRFRQSIILRKGFWLGSAYAVRRSAFNLQLFESILSQIGDYHLSYLDMTLGPFIIASNPNGKVEFINEVLFKYRAHGANSWKSKDKERALLNIQRWQVVHKSTHEILRKLINDNEVNKRYSYLNNELELLKSEYLNEKYKAIHQFISLIPSLFKEDKLFHELKRLMIILILGPSFLFKLKKQK